MLWDVVSIVTVSTEIQNEVTLFPLYLVGHALTM